LDTEMPLTREDVERLTARGHDPDDFSVRGDDGFTFLANVDDRCFFLDPDDRCTEYADRPEGCRLYPLVLDEEMSEFVLDRLCPHAKSVEPSEVHRRALLALLSRLAEERHRPWDE
jgi:Fe-S-cluster containining protein